MHRKRPSVSISFRLGAETAEALRAKADEANITSGKYAQLLVMQALNDDFNDELADDLSAIRDGMRRLRNDLSTSLEAILLNTVENATQDEIREWVRKNLRGE